MTSTFFQRLLIIILLAGTVPTLWAKEPLENRLKDTKSWELFENIEMPLVFTLYEMEQNGVKVEAEALKAYGDQLVGKITELEKDIYELAGEEFNINSPKQLGVILFEKMELPGGRKTKTGYSTAADVLDKLAPDYPVVSKVLEYRQLTKLKSTYADGLAGYIQEDGRIHGKFHQTVTATGRLSSAEPNLQNIPVRVELGRMIRKVFVPEEGYVFVDADYSQIELRVLAHCSQDEQLIQAYREEADIHRITASQVFHIPFNEVTPLQRRNAKAVNFGIVYGISSFGLSQDLSITRKEAAKYIEDYFRTYPGIKKFLDDTVAHAKENGYVVTLFGRRRPVPELSSSNFMQRSFGERVAMNAPIQGTAADIMKIAMIGVGRRLKEEHLKSRLVLQVHDELLIEAYEPEVEEVKKILEEEMEKIADIVFTDKAKLEALNAIVHPAVKEEIKKKICHEERKNTNLFILESALLIEDHYEEIYDELWYVYVKTEVRKNRLFYSRGYKESKIDDIMASQLTKEQFMKECDRVIDNNGVFAETMIQIDQIVKNL